MRLSSIALLATLIAYGAAIPLHPRAGSGTTGTGTDYSKLDQYPGAPVKAGSTTGDDAVLIKASEEKLTAKTLELKRLDAKLSDKDHEGVWPQLQKQREKAVTAMNSILENWGKPDPRASGGIAGILNEPTTQHEQAKDEQAKN